jgi:hypothetical protein
MAKTKTTVRFQILQLIDRFVDGATANDIGRTVVSDAKALIASGQSPARGLGRFVKYSDSYRAAIRKHRLPNQQKEVRPVNLWLTGSMLKGYGFRISTKPNTLEIGMVKGSARDKEIAGYHQSGTPKMPARPLVPGQNEEWAVSIMRGIRDRYSKRLAFLIRQSNKKS